MEMEFLTQLISYGSKEMCEVQLMITEIIGIFFIPWNISCYAQART